jgi:hypothetical protein
MNEELSENEEQGLLSQDVPQRDFFETLMQLKETVEQVNSFTGNVATIAESMARVRISDNNVMLMSEKIAADKEKWHELLTKTFSGRDKAIDAFIDQIANGTKEKNNDLILKAMDGLSNIVSSSPWPSFESFNKLIDSDDDIII